MTQVQATRRIEFDAGHRVTRHESKCRNVHGHRYRVDITVKVDAGLDSVGRVADFGAMKEVVGAWVDEHLDHGYLAHHEDPVGHALHRDGHKVFTMPAHLGEPTAENIATLLAEQSQVLLDRVRAGIVVTRVRVYETPNCWADWSSNRGGPTESGNPP